MKKFAFSIALTLCLVLALFAFASCGGKTKTPADTTAAATTTAATTAGGNGDHVHVWDEDYTTDVTATCSREGVESIYCSICREIKPGSTRSVPMLDHTPATTYTVDAPETCSANGSKSIHCTVCGASIDGTAVPIPSDSTKHVVNDWDMTNAPTIFNRNGSRSGTCSLCSSPVNENLTWTPVVVNSSETPEKTDPYDDPNYGKGSFYISMSAEDARGDKHFYPNEVDAEGNDLWFEYSILWNPTLANYDGKMLTPNGKKYDDNRASIISLISFRKDKKNGGDGGTYKDFYRLSVKNGASVDCPYAGGIDLGVYRPRLEPAYTCVQDLGGGKPYYKGSLDDVVTEASFPTIGEYGWHRIGFRFHQDTVLDEEHPYPYLSSSSKNAAIQSGYSELYIDGVLIWRVETNMQGTWDPTARSGAGEWADRYDGLRINGISLYETTVITDGDVSNLKFSDNRNLIVEMKIQDFFTSTETAIVAYDDVHLTCGNGFVLNVVPNESPVAENITLAEGVTVPGTVHFKLAD